MDNKITKLKSEEGEKLGDVWRLEKTAAETESGCPKFVRINRDLDTLITTAFNAGIERAVEVVEAKRKDRNTMTGFVSLENVAYNQALDDITTTLQVEVNKDKK